jgi:DNA polymerase-3 subunit gamma/tau
MAYTVLARRYRSNTFDEVVGQDHVAQTLKKAIESGRIAHAYLFCGTRGVGKTSMARIMAKALNCEKAKGPTTEPCGECNSCKAIARGEDIDVIEIDAASNTGVDNVRDLIANAQFRPARARFKIYIIDEVHMLSKAAFNALLKTMEEPPEHVKFILATTEPEKVLPTILSRCQRYDFRNIPTREIAQHLKEICKSEKIKADDDALLLVAKAGAGSMRDSLSLLDRLLSVGEKQLSIELIEQTLGMPRSQVLFDLAQSIGEGNVKDVLERADKLMTGGLSADTLVSTLADHFRNLLILRTCGPKSNLVEVPGIAIDDLVRQAERFDPIVLTQDIAILEELRRSLRTSQAGRALLDATLVRLTLAEQFSTVDELLNRAGGAPASGAAAQKKKFEIARAEGRGQRAEEEPQSLSTPAVPSSPLPPFPPSSAPPSSSHDDDDDLPRPGKVWDNSGPSLSELLKQQQALSPEPAPPQPKPALQGPVPAAPAPDSNIEPATFSDLSGVLERLVGALSQKSPSLPGLLNSARLVGIENGQAILQYPWDHGSVVKMLDRNGKKETIRDTLSALLHQNVGIKFELAQPPAEPEAAPIPARPQRTPAPAPARPPQRHAVLPSAPVSAPEPTTRLTDELKQQLRQDEMIKLILETLGGEIVKVD